MFQGYADTDVGNQYSKDLTEVFTYQHTSFTTVKLMAGEFI